MAESRRASPFDVELDPRPRPQPSSPTPSACSRSSRTCSRTPSSSPSRAACGCASRAATSGWSADHPSSSQARDGGRLRGHRHRHRHPAGEAAASSSRPSSRPTPAPAASTAAPASGLAISRELAEPARRRDPAAQHARAGQHVHPLPAAATTPARPCGPRRRAARRAAAAGRRARHRVCRARATSTIAGRPRRASQPGDPVLLIVEDDPHYARVLLDLARDKGFKVLVAHARRRGARAGPRSTSPTAISLDIFLPDMLGWTVLSQLKQDPATRHIPVQIVTLDEDRQHGLARGAFAFLTKPATTEGLRGGARRASRTSRDAARASGCWSSRTTTPSSMSIVRAARPRRHRDRRRRHRRARRSTALRERAVRLRGARPAPARHDAASSCWSRSQRRAGLRDVPVVVFTGKELTAEEDAQLHDAGAERRGQGRRVARAAARRDRAVPAPRGRRPAAGQAADARAAAPLRRGPARASRCWWSTTTCATSSRSSSVLERHGMKVLTAEHRPRGDRHRSRRRPTSRIVLMDIMMPEMDGYETMRVIRAEPGVPARCRSSRSPPRR